MVASHPNCKLSAWWIHILLFADTNIPILVRSTLDHWPVSISFKQYRLQTCKLFQVGTTLFQTISINIIQAWKGIFVLQYLSFHKPVPKPIHAESSPTLYPPPESCPWPTRTQTSCFDICPSPNEPQTTTLNQPSKNLQNNVWNILMFQ